MPGPELTARWDVPGGESAGFLHGDVPYLKIGQGPPLVMVPGLTPEHDVPTGWGRRTAVASARPLARDFTVYVANRKRGLKAGESMSDIAGHLAGAIEHDIGEPVFLQGTSTGGSVVLQLAVDRPELVRRLVVVSAAYRLGPVGREQQAEMARLIRAGQPREAWAAAITAVLPPALRRPARPLSRLAADRMTPADTTDLLVTLEAEDAFDVEASLSRVTAPTLVIGGGRDVFYSEGLFRGTAVGVQDGRLHIFPDWGHMRASSSPATANLALGFMVAGINLRPAP